MIRKTRVEGGQHHFTLVRAWATLVSDAHRSPKYRLARFRFEHEFVVGQLFGAGHRPDAVAEIEICDEGDAGQPTKQRWGLWLEADLATESPSFVAKKIRVATELMRAHERVAEIRGDALLFLVPSLKRLRSIARASVGFQTTPVFGCLFRDTSTTWSFQRGWYRVSDVLQDPVPETDLLAWFATTLRRGHVTPGGRHG